MLYLKRKDLKRRKKFLEIEPKYRLLKGMLKNRYLSLEMRSDIIKNYIELNSAVTQIKNRCVFTQRSRGVLRSFKGSRLYLKREGLSGYLVGIRKGSW